MSEAEFPIESDTVHVVAAAIRGPDGRVLIARRPPHVHQGGLWEFPGGKLEAGETASRALARELREELGIEVLRKRPLIRVAHRYPDKSVLLEVFLVDGFSGEPHGREGQPVAWAGVSELSGFDFPLANLPILRALQLPVRYVITPEPDGQRVVFMRALSRSLESGARLLQLRAHGLGEQAYLSLAREVTRETGKYGARVMLNAAPRLFERALAMGMPVAGVHLSAARLAALQDRPIGDEYLLAASCHNAEELAHAQSIGADFAVLSPVKFTASHPRAEPLGWEKFARLCDDAALPVYALGGLNETDLQAAWTNGGQGVAAIRGFWGSG